MNQPAATDDANLTTGTLRAKRIGIDTYQQPVIYMRSDCHVCRSEVFAAQPRVQVSTGIIATPNVVNGSNCR